MFEMYDDRALKSALRVLLCEKYPGVAIRGNTGYMTVHEMMLLVSKDYEELPDDIKPDAERLILNAALAKILGSDLDWFYTTEQAREFMADEELFKGTFAVWHHEKYSVQYLMNKFDKDNLILREVHMYRGSVHLVGSGKYREVSGYCPRKPSINKYVLSVRADNPELFMKVARQLIEQNGTPSRWKCKSH